MRVAETNIHTVTISKWGEVANFQTELWEFVHCKGSQMYSPCHTHFKTGREKSTDELAFCSVTTTSPALPSWMVWIWLEMFLVGLHPIPPSHFLNIYIYIWSQGLCFLPFIFLFVVIWNPTLGIPAGPTILSLGSAEFHGSPDPRNSFSTTRVSIFNFDI